MITSTWPLAAAFMSRYVHFYAPSELGELDQVSLNFKMLAFFIVPHFAVLALTYLRLSASLKHVAMTMRERQSAETFRKLFEAARIEVPEPPASATRAPAGRPDPKQYDSLVEDSML